MFPYGAAIRMKLNQTIKASLIFLRNVIMCGNILSLTLLKKHRKLIEYIQESLFLYLTLNSRRALPQQNVFNILPCGNIEKIRLGNLKEETWFWASSSWANDIVSLCLICQIIKPKMIFEIGTMRGYTALHFALNTVNDARIYTLDLQKDENLARKLKTTIVDDINIKLYLKSRRY